MTILFDPPASLVAVKNVQLGELSLKQLGRDEDLTGQLDRVSDTDIVTTAMSRMISLISQGAAQS